MNAYLLAAGLGTRLRPHTYHTPKCLIDIHGTPLLGWWLQLLEQHGIQRVLINTHYLADQVEAYLDTVRPKTKMDIITVHEPVLLGSAGTLLQNRSFISSSEDFLIAYADILTLANLTKMKQAHQAFAEKGSLLTMGLFHTPYPASCGIVTVDSSQIVTGFIEKPENPTSNLANAGIYIANPSIFDYLPATLPDSKVLDIGFDLLPLLVNRMHGFPIEEYLKDIGHLDAYAEALKTFPAALSPSSSFAFSQQASS